MSYKRIYKVRVLYPRTLGIARISRTSAWFKFRFTFFHRNALTMSTSCWNEFIKGSVIVRRQKSSRTSSDHFKVPWDEFVEDYVVPAN